MNYGSGLNFLIEPPPSLPVRLWREATVQTSEFAANPGGYVKSSLANDAIGRKRIRLMMFGISIGFLFIVMLIGVPFLFWYLAHRNVQAATIEKKR